jgi:hypothetical protein
MPFGPGWRAYQPPLAANLIERELTRLKAVNALLPQAVANLKKPSVRLVRTRGNRSDQKTLAMCMERYSL